MADGGTITEADTGQGPNIDPTTGQPQTQSFQQWFKQHEMLSLVIAGGVLLLTAILVFRKNQSSSGTPSGDLGPQSTDTSGQTDNSGALAAALNQLANLLNQLTSQKTPVTLPPPSPGTTPPPPSPPPTTPPPGHKPPVRLPPPSPGTLSHRPPVTLPPPSPGSRRHPPLGRLPPPSPGTRRPPPGGRLPPPSGELGMGGTGDITDDYPTVAQWTPDNAPIQQSLSNITNGETSAVTRIESLFANLVPDQPSGPTDLLQSNNSGAWAPVPVGVPFSSPPSSPAGAPGAGSP